ncbi:reverse transcriptase, partial [Colletotrichum incanum]
LLTVPSTHTIVVTDGSRAIGGATGYRYAVYRNCRRIAQGCGRLGLAKVFDAEVEGTWAAVIHGLRGDPSETSQAAFLGFQSAARIHNIRTHESSGHQGIKGYKEADQIAKNAKPYHSYLANLLPLQG